MQRSSALGRLAVLVALALAACGEATQNGSGSGGGDAGAGNEAGEAGPGLGGSNGATSNTTAGDHSLQGGAGADQGEGAASTAGASEGGRGETGSSGRDGAGTAGADSTEGGGGQATGGPDVQGCLTAAGAPVVSGTRLKAKCVRSADGAQTYRRGKLFDSELGDDCAFRTAADGSWRCLPTLHPPISSQTYFTDDQCTVKTVWFDVPCDGDVPKFLYTLGTNPGCDVLSEKDVPVSIYPVGAKLGIPDGLYSKTPGGCIPQNKPAGQHLIYALGEELPVKSFVAGTKEVAP